MKHLRTVISALLLFSSLGLLNAAHALAENPALSGPPSCSPPKVWDPILQRCVCPPPFVEEGDSCVWPPCVLVCPPCPPGTEPMGPVCVPVCPPGTVWDPTLETCVDPDPEASPGCDPDQPWIGYSSTQPAKDVADGLGVRRWGVCEGEQWDGQDPVRPEGDPCETHADLTDVATPSFSVCHGPDPNECCEPFGFRFSVDEDGVYGGVGGDPAASVAVFVAPRDGGVVGAVYFRDNTPGNVLFTLYSALRLDKGHVAEGDCDQAAYEEAARSSDPSLCGRDNTALGAYAGLP